MKVQQHALMVVKSDANPVRCRCTPYMRETLDLAEAGAAELLKSRIDGHRIPIDVLVNNAGVWRDSLDRYSDNLGTDYEGRRGDPVVVNGLETGTFHLDPSLTVRVAAIPQLLPKWCQQVLHTPQPTALRCCHVLDEQQSSARPQNAQHLL